MKIPGFFSFQSPVKILSGKRALENIPIELAGSDARKPLVLCRAQGDGTAEKFAAAFGDSGVSIVLYEGIPDEPDLPVLRELWGIYRDRGCDAIVALGGGTAADAAKVLNIAVSGRPEDVELAAGGEPVTGPLRPFIYCPTAPGDGRETSRFARLGGFDFSSVSLMPGLAVIDPRLLKEGKPGALVAAGARALSTAVEACLITANNPLIDTYAGVVIRLLAENAAGEGKRSVALMAAANALCLSGIVLSNTVRGPAARLAAALTMTTRIPETAALAILLPHAAALLAEKNPAAAAELLLALAGADVFAGTPPGERADHVAPRIRILLRDLAVAADAPPASLETAGVPKESLTEAVDAAALEEIGFSRDEGIDILSRAWTRTLRT